MACEHIPAPESPHLTNATEKSIDLFARKSMIYIGITGAPSGLRTTSGGEGRRENTQTERKNMLVGGRYGSHHSLQEPAGTRVNTR